MSEEEQIQEVPEKESPTVKKSWFFSIQNFNDKIAHLVSFNTKLLMFVMLVFFVYLFMASLFQGEIFSIKQLNVHPIIEEKGYNSAFIARKISYDITTIVNDVPDKLFSMFSGDKQVQKNKILYEKIMDKYTRKEIKIDIDVNVGGVSLPLRKLAKTARSVVGIENKSLDGDITVEEDLMIMTLGFNSNDINVGYQSKRYRIPDADSSSLYDILEVLTADAAKFVLANYDPLVTLLIDYNKDIVYSSRNQLWREDFHDENERLQILEDMYLNYEEDREIAAWAHAITGAIFFDKYNKLKMTKWKKRSLYHFEEAINLDPSFIDIVGRDIAIIYERDADSSGFALQAQTYQRMIKSDPRNLELYTDLLKVLADQKNEEAYFNTLNSAFQHGLHVSKKDLRREHFKIYKNDERFQSLMERYNENNKP